MEDRRLPALHTAPPLLREHRLYQADWLLRYYHFSAQELLTEEEPNFDPYLDPKCTWAVRHPEFFPVEVNTAGKEELLRVPGIGPKSAIRILQARRTQNLGMAELKRIGVVLKRAQYFITCRGKAAARGTRAEIAGALLEKLLKMVRDLGQDRTFAYMKFLLGCLLNSTVTLKLLVRHPSAAS